MTEQEFRRIVQYMESKCGLDLLNKKVLIEGRMESFINKNGFDSYNSFMDKVEADRTGRLLEELINILTTNHTYFMRESEHFDFLKEVALPWVKQKERNSKDLRIWCAASSTGEEPYTIAMVIRDFFAFDLSAWDTTLLATDISTEVLKFAVKGRYQKEQIELLPKTWQQRYLKELPDGEYEVNSDLKKGVLFRQFNLMNPLPFRKRLHIVFLRNVMIYFERPTKTQLLQRIYDAMEPGGYLFIGTTESIDRGSTGFEYVQPSVYRKPGIK